MKGSPTAARPTQRRRRVLSATVSSALVLVPVLSAQLPVGASGPAAVAATLSVGSLTLHRCPRDRAAWCGSVPVPFDRADPTSGRLDIGFMWFAATGGRVDGTIVATEGGPGYPSSGTRGQYLPLFRPLLDHHNLLLVDNRGTGMSEVITCPSLDTFHGPQPSPAFTEAVRLCADHLDHQRRRSDGRWVHGADLYGTANAARDMADVLTALRTGPVDLYGDSYGTWFAQTFASRYPSMLHSITLDASYQVLDLSPWYISTVTTSRLSFDAACRRSLSCRDRGEAGVWGRIGALIARLRTAPVEGTVVDNSGRTVRARVDVRALVNVVNDAGVDTGVYRQLDGAARAFLESNDPAPLLRLTVQTVQFDEGGSSAPFSFSSGLYMAVACTDYPQLFDMRANPQQRRAQLAKRIAALPPGTFAPFSTAEWMSMDAYTETYTSCIDWPAPVHIDPPIVIEPPLVPPTIPVLVLGGDLDTLTPSPFGGRVVARDMGPSARFVSVPNTTHVTALLDGNHCASILVQDFVAAPGQLASLDTSCTRDIPEVKMVGDFPERLSDAVPAHPEPGARPGDTGAGATGPSATALRAATVATDTVGDALARYNYVSGATGTGLRGGSFTATSSTPQALTIHLAVARWVTDAATDGIAVLDTTTGWVRATVRISTLAGTGQFVITWLTGEQRSVASVSGTFSGQRVSAVVAAP